MPDSDAFFAEHPEAVLLPPQCPGLPTGVTVKNFADYIRAQVGQPVIFNNAGRPLLVTPHVSVNLSDYKMVKLDKQGPRHWNLLLSLLTQDIANVMEKILSRGPLTDSSLNELYGSMPLIAQEAWGSVKNTRFFRDLNPVHQKQAMAELQDTVIHPTLPPELAESLEAKHFAYLTEPERFAKEVMSESAKMALAGACLILVLATLVMLVNPVGVTFMASAGMVMNTLGGSAFAITDLLMLGATFTTLNMTRQLEASRARAQIGFKLQNMFMVASGAQGAAEAVAGGAVNLTAQGALTLGGVVLPQIPRVFKGKALQAASETPFEYGPRTNGWKPVTSDKPFEAFPPGETVYLDPAYKPTDTAGPITWGKPLAEANVPNGGGIVFIDATASGSVSGTPKLPAGSGQSIPGGSQGLMCAENTSPGSGGLAIEAAPQVMVQALPPAGQSNISSSAKIIFTPTADTPVVPPALASSAPVAPVVIVPPMPGGGEPDKQRIEAPSAVKGIAVAPGAGNPIIMLAPGLESCEIKAPPASIENSGVVGDRPQVDIDYSLAAENKKIIIRVRVSGDDEENRNKAFKAIQKVAQGLTFVVVGIDGDDLQSIDQHRKFFASTDKEFLSDEETLSAWMYADNFDNPALVIYDRSMLEPVYDTVDQKWTNEYEIKKGVSIQQAVVGVIKIVY